MDVNWTIAPPDHHDDSDKVNSNKRSPTSQHYTPRYIINVAV